MFQARPYQAALAISVKDTLDKHNIAYLSSEVRIGKTIIAMLAAELRGSLSVLFITKKSAGEDIIKSINMMQVGCVARVVSYGQIHKLPPTYFFDIVILDEAHCLGQFPKPAEKAKKLKELVGDKPVIYLSGTPHPESYSQIYHQFWVSNYSPFKEYENFYKWAHEFVNIKQVVRNGHPINDYKDAYIDKIDAVCGELFITYTQEQAGFKQEIREEIHAVAMKNKTYNLLDRLKKERFAEIPGVGLIMAGTAVSLRQKLHQVCSGTVRYIPGLSMTDMLPEQEPTSDSAADQAAAMQELPDLSKTKPLYIDNSKALYIRDHFAGKKIAIFYTYQAEGEMLRKIFKSHTESDGEFNATDHNTVYIKQVVSGREGTNLSSADYLIMYNIDYSALSYIQGRARMQSFSRTKECVLVWVFAKMGIEEKIYRTVVRKEDYTIHRFKYDYELRNKKTLGVSDTGSGNNGAKATSLVRGKDNKLQHAGVSRHNSVPVPQPSLFSRNETAGQKA